MVVAVGAVVVAVAPSAVDVAVKELKVLQDGDEAVEIFSVQVENIDSVRSCVASWSTAVVVQLRAIHALVIRTDLAGIELPETIDDLLIRSTALSICCLLARLSDFLLG